MTYQEIAKSLVNHVDQVEQEARSIYESVVAPTWETRTHRYPRTLYALMMMAFATIDLASLYWEGYRGDQTDRMRRFMDRYISMNAEANDVAIQMWRHTLMHTSSPRSLLDERTNVGYRWLLHWSQDKLGSLGDFTFAGSDTDRILNLSVFGLIDGVRKGIDRYIADLEQDPTLQKNCVNAHVGIKQQTFRSRART